MPNANNNNPDPLQTVTAPDRVFYATGVLLDAVDFQAEQLYHRSRLARTLNYLHGCGTAAGLRVKQQPETMPPADQPQPDLEIQVEPGLAIDRLGRLIEVPRPACLRLNRWYAERSQDRETNPLVGSLQTVPNPQDTNQTISGVVLDLFLHFVTCERGKTPAFAYGAYSALNAIAPARVRDGYELSLVIRKPSDSPPLPLPRDPWSNLFTATGSPEARRLALHDAILDAWNSSAANLEYANVEDKTAVFLARLILPATSTGANTPPDWDRRRVIIDNSNRLFVYTSQTLVRWLTTP